MTTVLQALNSFQLQLGNEAQPRTMYQLEWMTDTPAQCGHYNPRVPTIRRAIFSYLTT